jgi:microcystin-dependent protein
MSDQFVGEIRIFGCNFAPFGWAICDGSLMPISQNTALFSLLGINFGGNGTSTFGLPNLQGRVPVDWGQGPGLSTYVLGQMGGAATVTLNSATLATHSHPATAGTASGTATTPAGNIWATAALGRQHQSLYAAASPQNATTLSPQAVLGAGGGQPHNNLPPYQVLNFCIALQGIYPPRG